MVCAKPVVGVDDEFCIVGCMYDCYFLDMDSCKCKNGPDKDKICYFFPNVKGMHIGYCVRALTDHESTSGSIIIDSHECRDYCEGWCLHNIEQLGKCTPSACSKENCPRKIVLLDDVDDRDDIDYVFRIY